VAWTRRCSLVGQSRPSLSSFGRVNATEPPRPSLIRINVASSASARHMQPDGTTSSQCQSVRRRHRVTSNIGDGGGAGEMEECMM
jgi:hypothetical protein